MPHKFIDHTHSLAILALADQSNAEDICRKIYGKSMVIVPYVMPGFELAKKANECFLHAEKEAIESNIQLKGMILLKHGV